jgi:ATP-dependent Lhr-like helicase
VGLAGERQTNSYKFYAVFKENEEYTVRNKSQELGTIVSPPPMGEKIALAGQVWLVEEIDHQRHLVYCSEVKGKVPAFFGLTPGDINTRVLEKMRAVLAADTSYPYLMKNAVVRLEEARRAAQNSGLTENPLICLGGDMWCLFPWLGTYPFLAMERFIKIKCGPLLGLSALDSSRPYFIQLKMKAGKEKFFQVLKEMAEQPLNPMDLVYKNEVPVFEKYDEFLPDKLVKKGFAHGILGLEEMKGRIRGWR